MRSGSQQALRAWSSSSSYGQSHISGLTIWILHFYRLFSRLSLAVPSFWRLEFSSALLERDHSTSSHCILPGSAQATLRGLQSILTLLSVGLDWIERHGTGNHAGVKRA